jgi:restriction system protein
MGTTNEENQEMTFLDAAYEILKQTGAPLHYAKIANRALAAGMLDTRGQTPDATMGSRLYVDTKRSGSRFRRVSRGVFALAEAQPGDIGQRIESLNRKTRADLRKRLLGVLPDRFEALISELLIAIGFDEATVEVTRHSGDGGIDVRGLLRAGGVTEVNAAVQVKRWKRNIQAPTVRDLRGSLTVHEQGILITTSDFSSGARKEAEEAGKTRISLVDGEQLLELVIQHGIGVTQEQHTLLSLDEEWWGELASEPTPSPPVPPLAKPALPAVSYPLPIQATTHGQTFEAELLDAKGRTRYAGVKYRSPSGAGQVASGWKSCNGWTFWRYRHAETGAWRVIDELRSKS